MSPTKLQKNTPVIILIIIVCASMLVVIAAIAIGHKIRHNVLKQKGLLPTHNSYYVLPAHIDPAHRAMHLQVPKPVLTKKERLSKKGEDDGRAPEVSE
jgi:hypothetical protein